MEEENYFDILLKYAKDKGYDYYSTADSKHFISTPGDPIKNKKVIYFKIGNIYFVAFDSFATKMGSSTVYCGLFCEVNVPDNNLFSMIKRSFLTNFLTANTVKTDNSYMNKKLTMSSEKRGGTLPYIKESEVDLFLEISNEFNALRMGISDSRVNEVADLHSKRILGLELNYWIVETKQLDFFISKGVDLLGRLKSRL